MNITRDATFSLLVPARKTLTPSYWLVVFNSHTTGLNNYCICTNLGSAKGPVLLDVVERGGATATATSGQVNLSPEGDWTVTVYEQTSDTNLDPALAGRQVWTDVLRVDSGDCTSDEDTGTECPPGGGDCVLCDLVNAAEAQTVIDCIPTGDVSTYVTSILDEPEATPEVIVVGLDGAGKTDDVKAIICDACSDASWTLKDTAGGTLDTGTIASGGSADIEAPDATVLRDGSAYGTVKSGGTIDVPSAACASASWTLTDSLGATLASGTIPSGGSDTIAAADGTIYTTDGITEVDTVTSGGTYSLPESRVRYTDADGVTTFTTGYDTALNTGLLLPDVTIPRRQILNTLGNPANATYIDLDDLIADTVPEAKDGTAVVKNSASTTLATDTAIPSGGSKDVTLRDITLTDQNGSTSSVPAGVDVDIRDYKSGILYRFGYPLWTGETTNYATGAEGQLFGSGWFDFTSPAFPSSFARLATWTTLQDNNVHGNTNRFTDENGAQTYTNNLVVDHLTGIMYYRTAFSAATWANALSGAEASTQAGYSDWHLPTEKVIETLTNYALGANNLNFAPFSLSINLWTCTTQAAVTTNARYFITANGNTGGTAKTGTVQYIICRKHLV